MLGTLIDFVAPAWTLARRVPVGVYVAIVVAGVIGMHLHNDPKRVKAAHEAGRVEGSKAKGDSIAIAAHAVTDSMQGVIAERDAALAVARAATDAVTARAARVAAAHAATDALYASLGALSEPAKADTTVRVLGAASKAVAAQNDTLRGVVGALGAAAATERTAATTLHAADSTALRAVSLIAIGVRDSLHVEQARPKRTWRGNAVAGAVGGGVLYGAKKAVEAIVHSIQHKARK